MGRLKPTFFPLSECGAERCQAPCPHPRVRWPPSTRSSMTEEIALKPESWALVAAGERASVRKGQHVCQSRLGSAEAIALAGLLLGEGLIVAFAWRPLVPGTPFPSRHFKTIFRPLTESCGECRRSPRLSPTADSAALPPLISSPQRPWSGSSPLGQGFSCVHPCVLTPGPSVGTEGCAEAMLCGTVQACVFMWSLHPCMQLHA